MAQLLRFAARISAQERTTAILHTRIEEISQDMVASFNQLAKYQIATERDLDVRFDKIDARFSEVDARFDKIDARFSEVDARFDKIDARFSEVDARFREVDARLNKIEANMATKDDLVSLEVRVTEDIRSLEARMATKDDLASLEARVTEDIRSLETRILDAFKQLVIMIDTRLPSQIP